jgi:hypothetical protein
MLSNTFCKFHFGQGCLRGDDCVFSHSPIPRSPNPCKGCDDRTICPYLHSDEKWTRWMPPIVHPMQAKKDADAMKADLIATHEELSWVYERLRDSQAEVKALRQEMDMRTYDELDKEIQETRMKDDLESATAAAEERGMINKELTSQLETMEATNQGLVNQLETMEATHQDLYNQLTVTEATNKELANQLAMMRNLAYERGRMLMEQRDAVLKALGI